MSLETAFTMDTSSIKFGKGVTREIGFDMQALGATRVMVVTDPSLEHSHAVKVTVASLQEAGQEAVVYARTQVEPTDASLADAARLVRNHRLWEMYLITHADIAPCHVDRDADQVEHVLGSDLVMRLEELMETQTETAGVRPPTSPHAMYSSGRPTAMNTNMLRKQESAPIRQVVFLSTQRAVMPSP